MCSNIWYYLLHLFSSAINGTIAVNLSLSGISAPKTKTNITENMYVCTSLNTFDAKKIEIIYNYAF